MHDANARLIAAAPDLLAALKKLLVANENYFMADDDERRSFLSDITEAEEAALAVIEKAVGQ